MHCKLSGLVFETLLELSLGPIISKYGISNVGTRKDPHANTK